MGRWHVPFLGIEEIPRSLTEFKIAYFFTYTPTELAALNSRKTTLLKVAVAIQLSFLRLSGGTLPRLKGVPKKVLDHIGQQLGVAAPSLASLRTLYQRRERTQWDPQSWAIQTAGFQSLMDRQRRVLVTRLNQQANVAGSVDEIVTYAREWCYEHQIIAPGDRVIRDMARKALADTDRGIYELVCQEIPELVRARWFTELSKLREREGISMLEWLMKPPGKPSAKTLSSQFERINYLKSLGVHHYPLAGITAEKLKSLAQGIRSCRPSRFRDVKEPRRTLEVVAFVRLALVQATDTAILIVDKRTRDLVREAQVATQKQASRRLASQTEVLTSIKRDVNDPALSDRAFREKIRVLLNVDTLTEPSNQSASIRQHLAQQSKRLRPILSNLAGLDIAGRSDESNVNNLAYLARVYSSRTSALPDKHGCEHKKIWQSILDGDDRKRALGGLEAATLLGLRAAFKRGSAWVSYSSSYRDPDDILISSAQWAQTKRRHYDLLSASESPEQMLKRAQASLEAGLGAVSEALAAGRLHIDQGHIRMEAMNALPPLPEFDEFERKLFAQVNAVQRPEILLEMDSQTRFSWILLGRPAENKEELLATYGALLAHGTAPQASGVAKMTPGLSEDAVRRAMRILEDESRLAEANRVLIQYQRRHSVTQHWGSANLASSDMMSLDASRQLWNARVDPRRRTYAIGTYTHLLGQWGIVYDQPIVLMNRQAGAAIEGVIRQEDVAIERLAVDTHGYTDFAFAIAKLLQFDLCPRLKSLKERKRYVPRNFRVPSSLEDVVQREVSLLQIRIGYDGLVRVAASIRSGASAILALERYGSAARADDVHKAGVHLGKMLRTIFLCDYLTNESFQREIRRILSRGESIHTLQRTLYAEPVPAQRGRRQEELVAISGSLRLLSN